MKIIAVIPARGGSKGIPGKNIYPLVGKPMLAYSIEQARQVPQIEKIIVSSDDDAILKVAKEAGAETVKRPPELAGDMAKMDGALKHVLDTLHVDGYDADVVVLLQPTSPLRTVATLTRAIETFLEHYDHFDSLMPLAETSAKVGTIEDNRFVPSYPPGIQRQEMKKLYFDCGTVHIFKSELIQEGKFFGERVFAFPINWPESLDIDTPEDMKLAELLIRNK